MAALHTIYDGVRKGAYGAGRLTNFSARFKERMLELVQDPEPAVALEVFNLLETALPFNVLNEMDIFTACDAVFIHYDLVSDDSSSKYNMATAQKVCQAAAGFALKAYEGLRLEDKEDGTESDEDEDEGERIATVAEAQKQLKAFVTFIEGHAEYMVDEEEEEDEEEIAEAMANTKRAAARLCDYCVDAFWAHHTEGASFLCNWKAMVSLLLSSSADGKKKKSGKKKKEEEEEVEINPTLLLRVFVAAAERACCFPGDTVFDPAANDTKPDSLSFVTNGVSKQKTKEEESKLLRDARIYQREELSRQLIQGLPKLLLRFKTDSNCVDLLARLTPLLHLGVYSTERQKQQFSRLLRILQVII